MNSYFKSYRNTKQNVHNIPSWNTARTASSKWYSPEMIWRISIIFQKCSSFPFSRNPMKNLPVILLSTLSEITQWNPPAMFSKIPPEILSNILREILTYPSRKSLRNLSRNSTRIPLVIQIGSRMEWKNDSPGHPHGILLEFFLYFIQNITLKKWSNFSNKLRGISFGIFYRIASPKLKRF